MFYGFFLCFGKFFCQLFQLYDFRFVDGDVLFSEVWFVYCGDYELVDVVMVDLGDFQVWFVVVDDGLVFCDGRVGLVFKEVVEEYDWLDGDDVEVVGVVQDGVDFYVIVLGFDFVFDFWYGYVCVEDGEFDGWCCFDCFCDDFCIGDDWFGGLEGCGWQVEENNFGVFKGFFDGFVVREVCCGCFDFFVVDFEVFWVVVDGDGMVVCVGKGVDLCCVLDVGGVKDCYFCYGCCLIVIFMEWYFGRLGSVDGEF